VPTPVVAVQVPLTPLVGNVVLQSQMLVAARHTPVIVAVLVAEPAAPAGQVAVKVVAVPVLAGKKLVLQVGTHAGDPNVAGKAVEVQPPKIPLVGADNWAKVHVCGAHVPVTVVRPVAPVLAPAAQVSDNVPK